jgi:serine/threonine protein kinase
MFVAEEELESFQRETSIMKALKHEHIVQLLDVFEDEDHYYVVMECVSGGELFDQIIELGNYSEKGCAELISQVCTAMFIWIHETQVFAGLAYMHEKGYAHRDIKPENRMYLMYME